MTIYFQHVGEAGGARDFPKTIGSASTGLVRRQWQQIEPLLSELDPHELQRLKNELTLAAPDGFQIWGIPSGARSAIRSLSIGDYLLLLESATIGGQFAYGGQVIARPSQECRVLSEYLWGEHKFPLIVFLSGGLTQYRWSKFCEIFGYKSNWNPAGQTYRITDERWQTAYFEDEDAFIEAFIGFLPSASRNFRGWRGVTLLDVAELDIIEAEGRTKLREHLLRERSSLLVAEFKRRLAEPVCSICGFNFFKMYGQIGFGFIEAHHRMPVYSMSEDHRTNVNDLIPVCSNCHSMLHRKYPPLNPEELRDYIGNIFSESIE